MSLSSILNQPGAHDAPLIALEGVSKTYGGQDGDATTVALADVSLAIEAGEFVCLTGPSGSGKSTLLNVIGCLTRPSAGACRIDGRDVSALSGDDLAALRRDVFGFVFQRANLLDEASSLANVELPAAYRGTRAQERRRRALELLASLGLAEQAPQRAGDLSGGQRQRVGIGSPTCASPPSKSKRAGASPSKQRTASSRSTCSAGATQRCRMRGTRSTRLPRAAT